MLARIMAKRKIMFSNDFAFDPEIHDDDFAPV